jgi:hypothetical protein
MWVGPSRVLNGGVLRLDLLVLCSYISGLFNGLSTSAPSHRARIPAPTNTAVTNQQIVASAIDFEQGVYYQRYFSIRPPSSLLLFSFLFFLFLLVSFRFAGLSSITIVLVMIGCVIRGILSSDGLTEVEQRWFAHRLYPSILVYQVAVGNPSAVSQTVQLSQKPNFPSLDVALQQVPYLMGRMTKPRPNPFTLSGVSRCPPLRRLGPAPSTPPSSQAVRRCRWRWSPPRFLPVSKHPRIVT